MFIISVLDDGEERLVLVEWFKVINQTMYATIAGLHKRFDLDDICDIVPIAEEPSYPVASRCN